MANLCSTFRFLIMNNKMKQTNETLKVLYMQDLLLPDTHHQRTTPKVRNPQMWQAIEPWYAADPLVISEDILNDPDRDIWMWSDIHWGHKNIIKYSGRPFEHLDAMNNTLVKNYHAVVKPQDIVIFGGDIGFLSENKINAILDQLPGYKIQIVGNHDLHRDGKLYQLNFNERHPCMVVNVGDYQLLFTHYPMDNVPEGCVNVHGHIHQWTANPWNINICVEHTNYAPRNIKSVMEQARKHLEK